MDDFNKVVYIIVEMQKYNDRGNEWIEQIIVRSKNNSIKMYEDMKDAEDAVNKLTEKTGLKYMIREGKFQLFGTLHKVKN